MKIRQAVKIMKQASLGRAASKATAKRAVRRIYKGHPVSRNGAIARRNCLFPVYRLAVGEWTCGNPTPFCPPDL